MMLKQNKTSRGFGENKNTTEEINRTQKRVFNICLNSKILGIR